MSDEVSQFLESVERLRGQQIEEDEVRARELEEYLAAKRERQARREERARSISPQKSSPANTPSPRSNRRSVRLSESLKLDSPIAADDSPREQSLEPDADPEADAMGYSSSPTKENQSPLDPDTKRSSMSTASARASPLSWQRRPNSRGGSRPLSIVAAQNATQRSLAGSQEPPSPAADQNVSRDQITQSLGSKDPAWFRQTADRGQNSAAYRRHQVEDEDRVDDMSVAKTQLPGMSAELPKDRAPSRSSTSTPPQGRLASPLPLNPPRFDGAGDDRGSADPSLVTAPTGRISPTRSGSPTKGMGGFVQSAMMKRSDSVKRWSVTSPPGLTRADSIASNRNTYDRSLPHASSRPQNMVRGGSTTPNSSRPTSQHGERAAEPETTPKVVVPGPVPEAKPTPMQDEEESQIPTSPSKTMDPRRWSPTKSSWLESALNKPESPKPQQKPPPSSQPAWMVELNKNKTEKGSTPTNDAGRPTSVSHKHQVSIGGLMKSSPIGAAAKPNTTGLGGIYSPPPGGNRPPFGHGLKTSLSKTTVPLESQEKSDDHPETPLEPEKRGSLSSPPATKPKPETPPKKDFRTNLKQRPTPADTTKTTEPEFKNVFGNLRRTKIQNYVAPDELKDNILQGKAALNTTGGPKKTERRDEFKDAILKKKDDFKKAQADGKGVTRSPTTAAEKIIPEGLAKRAELDKSARGTNRESTSDSTNQLKKTDSPKPSPGPKRISSQTVSSPRSQEAAPSPIVEKPQRVSTETSAARSMPILQKETSAPSRLQGRTGGGKLADRFNPALAGMLARGPPAAASTGQDADESSSPVPSRAAESTEPSAPGPQLTHMTKGRARGPRRKAPTAAAAPSVVETSRPTTSPVIKVETESPSTQTPVSGLASKEGWNEQSRYGTATRSAVSSIAVKKEEPIASVPVKPTNPTTPFSIQQQVAAKAAVRGKPSPVRPSDKSTERGVDAEEAARPPLRRRPTSPEKPSPELTLPLKPHKTGDASESQPSSPRKLDVKRMSKFLDESPVVSKPEPAREPVRLTHQRTGSRSPVKMFEQSVPEPEPSSPTKVDSDPVVSVKNAASMFGGASAKSPPSESRPSFARRAPDFEPIKTQPRAGTRPLPGPPQMEDAKSLQPVSSPTRSPAKNDVSTLLTDFFGSRRQRRDYKVDTAEVLMKRPQSGAKIDTLGFQMYQISGEGKKAPVPAHHERVLFEREMYICAHEFSNMSGRKIFEVYFWVGDAVPESAAEDAQLFVQREARSLGGKLVKIRQGNETAEFLQALGGVAIVRGGSSNKYDSLAPNMLCGRRCLGQVAFDEVDFAASSLCAGFPYLITQSGKCYLWKGKGSDVDELGCARLIGMDLTLTGELIEYEDGSEPASFWSMFDGGSKPHSADHWRLKPNYSKYCSRLFCSDAYSKQQVFEISPFSQADLSPASIYILDAFFEMYIIVGSRAQSQYASFHNALDFAQEYAILASSMEDRPFVPISTVVLEGIPRDLKSVFRKWTDERSPTVTTAGLKRGRSLRVVPLTQALQALSD